MLSHILMRQTSARCLGQMYNGIGSQVNQMSLTKLVGLTSAATQSVHHSTQLSVKSNSMLLTGTKNQQTERWITTLQQKQGIPQAQALGSRAMSSSHPKIWAAEKLVSLAMVPALIVPFVWTTPLTDAIFCTLG